ncbi:MAG: extensin family protein [Acidimicrobiales bacterium]
MTCATDCAAPTITRNHLFGPNWGLRHRLGWSGQFGVHGAQHNESFNAAFHTQLGFAFAGLNHYAVNDGPGTIEWIGDVGAKVCKTGCHSTGRAFDLTAVKLGPNLYDMNVIWRSTQPREAQRKYLAIWAAMRRDCATVLTAAYNTDHHNHIHIDTDAGAQTPPLRTSARTDTMLVQTACNLLNGASLTVDGSWGNKTSAAYQALLGAFRLQCTSPTTNYNHLRGFVELICRTAMADQSAGAFVGPC